MTDPLPKPPGIPPPPPPPGPAAAAPLPPCPVPPPDDSAAPRCPTISLPPPEDDRDAKGRFAKGHSGKKRGTRHKTTLAVEERLSEYAAKITDAAILYGMRGDASLLRDLLGRLAPKRGRLITIPDFPEVKSVADVATALAFLTVEVAAGRLAADEAAAVASVLEKFERATDTAELAARLDALEAAERGSR